jgi:hypothetical protein
MPLAPDILVIEHGGNAVRLTPSLRAAYRLHSMHGVDKLFAGIAEGRLGVILDILAEGGAAHPPIFRTGLRDTLDRLKKPLYQFLAISFGADDGDQRPTSKATSSAAIDIKVSLAALFEIGTGWLGWTPAETWAATPAEILAAQRGHVAKLKAIYGSGEKDGEPSRPNVYSTERLAEIDQLGHDPDFDRAGFAALKAKLKAGQQ